MPNLETRMQEIVGHELSSVEFVRDYIQFRFDGPCLTAITRPTLISSAAALGPNDPGFRDGLCSEIGVKVAAVQITGVELIIVFADSCRLVFSLRDEDYIGPESLNYSSGDGTMVVACPPSPPERS